MYGRVELSACKPAGLQLIECHLQPWQRSKSGMHHGTWSHWNFKVLPAVAELCFWKAKKRNVVCLFLRPVGCSYLSQQFYNWTMLDGHAAVLGPLQVAWPLKVPSTESTHASCFRPNVAVLQCQANAWRVCELSANETCTYIMYSHLIQERKHLEEGDLNRKTSLLKGPCPNPIAWCFLDVLLKSDNQRVESSSLHSVLCHQFSISQPTKCSRRVS